MKRLLFLVACMQCFMGEAQTINIYYRANDTSYCSSHWATKVDCVNFASGYNNQMSIMGTNDSPYPEVNYMMEDVDSITFYSKEECPFYVIDENYISTDFSKNGQISKLQKHEKGKGIPVVIFGEAFSDRMINLGLYDFYVHSAMDAFFAKEPFTTFRDYFDVYSVTIVSKREVVGVEPPFTFQYDDERLKNYLLKIDDLKGALENVTAIRISSLPTSYNGSYGTINSAFGIDNFNIGQTTATSDPVFFEGLNNYLVWHEACGHGFGLLADERVNSNATDVFPIESYDNLDAEHVAGMSMNIDYHDTPETVLWKDFISNPDYEIEGIGLYEGAIYVYSKGIFRPSDSSIMYGSFEWCKEYYNAPSRWAIYQRIMQLAGENCKFEDFLQYDKINLEAIKTK